MNKKKLIKSILLAVVIPAIYFDLLGMESTPIEKEMTFEDAKRYVKGLFKASDHKQVYVHEINGYNSCHYCVTIE